MNIKAFCGTAAFFCFAIGRTWLGFACLCLLYLCVYADARARIV